jgi:hypothetical protein
VILAYTILFALPLGSLVRRQSTAVLSYLLAGSYLLRFQQTSVMLSGSATRSPRLSAGTPGSSQRENQRGHRLHGDQRCHASFSHVADPETTSSATRAIVARTAARPRSTMGSCASRSFLSLPSTFQVSRDPGSVPPRRTPRQENSVGRPLRITWCPIR